MYILQIDDAIPLLGCDGWEGVWLVWLLIDDNIVDGIYTVEGI